MIISFKEWGNLIQKNFEKHFYVSTTHAVGDSKLINKRGIYKDTVNASQPWADFQLRPNFPIAMVVVSTNFLFFFFSNVTILNILKKQCSNNLYYLKIEA